MGIGSHALLQVLSDLLAGHDTPPRPCTSPGDALDEATGEQRVSDDRTAVHGTLIVEADAMMMRLRRDRSASSSFGTPEPPRHLGTLSAMPL
jgi:hypothetical protein